MEMIKNEKFLLRIADRGAEMKELIRQDTGQNLLWRADPEIWEWTAPVCCPWCGRLEDHYFEESGRRYPTGLHGFTRELGHKVLERKEDEITYGCEWKEDESLWPWSFQMTTTHRLVGNQVQTACSVVNTGSRDMPLQLGFHTGVICPFSEGKDAEDYQFHFEKEEAPDKSHILPVKKEMFDNLRIPFAGLESDWIRLEEKDSGKYIQLELEGYAHLILWSVPGIPGFLCMEPWTGFNGSGHDLWKRPGTVALKPGERFERVQKMTMNVF